MFLKSLIFTFSLCISTKVFLNGIKIWCFLPGLDLGPCKGAAVRKHPESFLRKVFEHETCQGNSPLVSGCFPFPGGHWPRAQCNCDGSGNLLIALASV